jgi:hypothetical protein
MNSASVYELMLCMPVYRLQTDVASVSEHGGEMSKGKLMKEALKLAKHKGELREREHRVS